MSEQGSPTHHPAHPGGERDRRHHGQPLRYRRDGERDPRLDRLPQVSAAQRAQSDHHRRQRQHEDHQAPPEAVEASLQRCRLVHGLLEQVADPSDLGRGAGRDDDRFAAARRRERPLENHRSPVGHGEIARLRRLDRLGDRERLAGQWRLDDQQLAPLDQPRVGGDGAARLERDDVAGHQIGGVDRQQRSAAPHRRLMHLEVAQRFGLASCAKLGGEADRRVDQQDRGDGERLDEVLDQEGDDRRHDQ